MSGGRIEIGYSEHGEEKKGLSSELLDNGFWDAFGDLLDEALLLHYPNLHESIKTEEGYYMDFFTFRELSKEDFNLAVRLIREHVASMTPNSWPPRKYVTDMAGWQEAARRVWKEIAEPLVVLDRRYDENLARISPNTTKDT